MMRELKSPADAYFQVIGEANVKALEELYMQKKKEFIFSEKLDAYFDKRIGAEREARGIAIGEARGEARGKAEAGRNTVIAVLRARFKRVPRGIEKAVRAISDPIALESWAVQAATCHSLDEFAEALK